MPHNHSLLAAPPPAHASRHPSHWWRRVGAFTLGILLPWSLLSQGLGTLLTGRSWPEGPVGPIIGVVSFGLVVLLSAAFTRDGQSMTHRLVGLQVCDLSGAPVSASRMALRNLAHLVDIATFGLGFLWPLVDRRGATFADKIMGTQVLRAAGSTASSVKIDIYRRGT